MEAIMFQLACPSSRRASLTLWTRQGWSDSWDQALSLLMAVLRGVTESSTGFRIMPGFVLQAGSARCDTTPCRHFLACLLSFPCCIGCRHNRLSATRDLAMATRKALVSASAYAETKKSHLNTAESPPRGDNARTISATIRGPSA